MWQTSSRLLATLINEGLVKISVTCGSKKDDLRLRIAPRDEFNNQVSASILVRLHEKTHYVERSTMSILPLSPDDLALPITWEPANASHQTIGVSTEPGMLFDLIFPWLGYDSGCKPQIVAELSSSAKFQSREHIQYLRSLWHQLTYLEEKWLQEASFRSGPSLHSPSIDWERAIIRGHPSHPVRSLYLPLVSLRGKPS